MSKEVLKNQDIEYIHLISGGDFPIKGSSYFTEYLTMNRGKEFLENFQVPTKKWQHGGMNRLTYYNFYDFFDIKTYLGSKAIYYTLKIQEALKMKRKISDELPKFHGGSTWWTLSSKCLKYVVDYTDNANTFLKRLKHTLCSEEIFFQTIIMNSPFRDNVVNDNLRYIIWEYKHGSIPAILDIQDNEKIKKSHQLFARKFEYPFSLTLLNELKNK